MKVTIKLKFNAHKPKIENFGNRRYLVYLMSDNADPDAYEELKELMSRSLGVPTEKIEYVGKDANGDFIFET